MLPRAPRETGSETSLRKVRVRKELRKESALHKETECPLNQLPSSHSSADSKNQAHRAEEIAKWIKCPLHMSEDLCSSPQNPWLKSQVW